MALIKMLLFTLVVGYIVFGAVIYIFQHKLVYFPTKDVDMNPHDIGLEYESIFIKVDEDVKIHAWYVPKKDAKTTLFFLHGNGGNISHRLDSIKLFNSLEMNVLIFDYRGYGNSEGSANEQNTYDDAKSAWEYLLKDKGVKPEDIIIFGRSLGGTIAANLGSTLKPKAIILESTFTTVNELVSDIYSYVPKMLIRFKYETTKYLKDINCPILVVHSVDDDIIPYRFGEAVFGNANEPKTFVKISGDHNHGFLQSKEIYLPALKKFLQELDKDKSQS